MVSALNRLSRDRNSIEVRVEAELYDSLQQPDGSSQAREDVVPPRRPGDKPRGRLELSVFPGREDDIQAGIVAEGAHPLWIDPPAVRRKSVKMPADWIDCDYVSTRSADPRKLRHPPPN